MNNNQSHRCGDHQIAGFSRSRLWCALVLAGCLVGCRSTESLIPDWRIKPPVAALQPRAAAADAFSDGSFRLVAFEAPEAEPPQVEVIGSSARGEPESVESAGMEAGVDEDTGQNRANATTRRQGPTLIGQGAALTGAENQRGDEVDDISTQLELRQVLQSVAECYPLIEVAIAEIEEARGQVIASWGEFDDIFSAHSISQPLGFYQTYRNGAGLTRPLYGGGEVYGTYRIGDGNFEPWFGERETNEGGEFKAGFALPLIKNRDIDPRRAALQAARADRNGIVADVDSRLLQFQRFATQAYWDWMAAGQAVGVQQQLLDLAERRVDQFDERVQQGDMAEITRIDNDRFIAKRMNELIKARRMFEKATIKLSLFLRDINCDPVMADAAMLAEEFPESQLIDGSQVQIGMHNAITSRPELAELAAQRVRACVDLRYAENLTLPKLDLKGFAGQDVGGETSSTGDKTPFELQIGVEAEVPIQRREGLGKIRAARAKLEQIDAKTRFAVQKIRAEVQDAASGMNAAHQQTLQSKRNVALARKSLELGRLSFEAGDIELLALNIYETAVADAELELLDAQQKYFFYQAAYETAVNVRAFDSIEGYNQPDSDAVIADPIDPTNGRIEN